MKISIFNLEGQTSNTGLKMGNLGLHFHTFQKELKRKYFAKVLFQSIPMI